MANQRPKLLHSIKQYGNRLFVFIRNRVRSNEEAEDILQEVWYQFSRIINLDEVESISGWLFRVARNKITDRYRKQSDDLYEDLLFGDSEGAVLREILFSTADTPEDAFFKELFWEELTAALDELPEAQRNAYVWNELEGMTLREIAEKSNESIKTIISRKQYAIKHLRKRLQALYDDL
ncbi:MAG: RNA polymerase sigma factor [Cyclobacteriaceae bacterium]